MQEIFYEETTTLKNYKSEKNKHTIIAVLSILSYICAAFFALLIFYKFDWRYGNMVLNIVVLLLILASFIAGGVFLGLLKNKFCIEYDYILVNGTINIDKVIKGTKRKSQIEFLTLNILKIGKFCSDEYYKTVSDDNIDVKVFTSNDEPIENKDFYYLLVAHGAEKIICVLECTKQFIINLVKFSNKTVVEKGLWFILIMLQQRSRL